MNTKWESSDIPDQTDRVILVTGANSGLGYYSALALAAKGARVLLACRSLHRGGQAKAEIIQSLPQAHISVVELDLADLESVRACTQTLLSDYDRLDILMNNAGVMAIPRRETEQGFERQIGVNHLGHFALTGALMPLLLETPHSRIVNVSSIAHRSGRVDFDDLHGKRKYSRFGAYSQSKLANLLFTLELQRLLASRGADAVTVAAHPGYAATNLQYAGPREKSSKIEMLIMRAMNAVFAQSAEQGALPQLFAATEPNISGGDFVGPDGWMGMRGHPRKLRAKETAYDEETARRLWQMSVDLTGEPYEILEP